MKIEIETKPLADSVGFLAGLAHEGKKNFPGANQILLRSNGGGQIYLSACCMDGWARLTLDLPGPKLVGLPEETIAVSAEVLARQVESFRRSKVEQVRFETFDGSRLRLKAGKTTASISGRPGADFPEIPWDPPDPMVFFSPAQWRFLLTTTMHCAEKAEDNMQALDGVLLVMDEGRARTVSTDKNRMALATLSTDAVRISGSLFLASDFIERSLGFLKGSGEQPVCIGRNDNLIYVWNERAILSSCILGIKFPEFERISKEENGGGVVVDLKSLKELLWAAQPFADRSDQKIAPRLTLSYEASELTVRCSSIAGDFESSMEASGSVEAFSFAGNPKFLLDAIYSVSSCEKAILIRRPGVFSPLEMMPMLEAPGESVHFWAMGMI